MHLTPASYLYRARAPRGPFRWVGGVAAALLLALPGGAHGQALADPLVPRGRVRLDFVPSVASWDTRYGATGDEEALGSDLTDPRGVSLFPGVATLEKTLRALSGDAGFEASLGSTTGRLSKEMTRLDIGLRIGVFDWLTVGANVPYVKGSSALDFAFRPDSLATLGLNPAFTGDGDVGDLLAGLGDAAVAARARAETLCAGGGGSACQAATALSDRANAFWSGLLGAYFGSPFFPVGSSAVAQKLQDALSALDGELAAAGLARAPGSLAFASGGLDETAFLDAVTTPSLGIGMSALRGYPGLWQLGDVEVNATLRLLEGERRDSGAVAPRLSYGVYGGFLLRLGTGVLDDPDVPLDLESGDGQMDMEGRVDALLRVGSRVGFRGGFRYGTQRSVDILRRVAPHEALLPLVSSYRAVTWTPGSYTLLELSPRVHLGESLAITADYRRYHKGEDAYTLVSAGDGGTETLDASVLARESEVTLQELAVGLRYSSLRLWRQGRVGTPAEMGVRLIRPLAGSGGRTPKATRVELSVSLFRRIWGS
ncbi:MAG: hypothetical protein AMXMBFR53_37230 [Gemmatimonadota bacterium]